jgi:hypothetical protein
MQSGPLFLLFPSAGTLLVAPARVLPGLLRRDRARPAGAICVQ